MKKLNILKIFILVIIYILINYFLLLLLLRNELLNKVSEHLLKFYNFYILQKKVYRYGDLTLIPISLILSWFFVLFFILISFYFLKKKNHFDKSYYGILLFHLGLLLYYIKYFF